MTRTTIEWTHYLTMAGLVIQGHTCNAWWGCSKVSPACDNCYAWILDGRRLFDTETHWESAPRLVFPNWHKPALAWNRHAERSGYPERVFCGSMCDVMERNDKDGDLNALRQQLYDLIEQTPNLIWMLLTKRPHEYKKFLRKAWLKDPPANVWLLTTVENADYLWRIDEELKAPAVVHGISVEPMLGPVKLPKQFLRLGNRAWVIAGGESGRGKGIRPSLPDWFRDLRNQCVDAGVPFFFKQWGNHNSELIQLANKHDAGRLLDGREWNEYPGVQY